MSFSFTTCRSRLTIPAVSTIQIWKRVCIILCQKTVIKSNNRSRPFSFLFVQQFYSMLSDSTTFETNTTPTSVDSMSRIFMFLLLSTGGIIEVQSGLRNFCFQRFFFFLAPHLEIFTWHFNWLDVSTNWRQFPCSQCSLGLRAPLLCHIRFPTSENCSENCSHWCPPWTFSVQVEFQDVVLDVDRDELLSSMPVHQTFEVYLSFPCQFCCAQES